MLRVEPRDAGFRAVLDVGADLLVLPDHFPGNPILPGICMVQAILVAGAMIRGVNDLRLVRLKNAKMMQPIQPGDKVMIESDTTDTGEGEIHLKAKLVVAGQKRAEFSLIARAI